jgi:hypothetical protein
VLDVERSSPDANITDFGDAIWRAVSTIAAVGYGDRYPVTRVGCLVALADEGRDRPAGHRDRYCRQVVTDRT